MKPTRRGLFGLLAGLWGAKAVGIKPPSRITATEAMIRLREEAAMAWRARINAAYPMFVVETANIADAAVTQSMIADGAIATTKITMLSPPKPT